MNDYDGGTRLIGLLMVSGWFCFVGLCVGIFVGWCIWG